VGTKDKGFNACHIIVQQG